MRYAIDFIEDNSRPDCWSIMGALGSSGGGALWGKAEQYEKATGNAKAV